MEDTTSTTANLKTVGSLSVVTSDDSNVETGPVQGPVHGAVSSKIKFSKFVYIQAFLSCMSSLNVGYDIGIIATSIIYMEDDIGINDNEIGLIVSIANFFAILGSIIGGHLADKFGRKPIILLTSILSCIAVVLMSVTSNIFIILLSRGINGTSFGIALAITPLYMAEVSPSSIRGKLVSLTELFNSMGMIIGYIIGYLFSISNNINNSPSLAWRLLVGSGGIISLILFISMIFMPESPRWLMQHGYKKKAKESLSKSYIDNNEENIKLINKILNEMEESNSKLKDETNETDWKSIVLCCFFYGNNKDGSNSNNKESKIQQKSLMIGIPNAIFQQLSAIEIFIYYTPKILEQIGIKSNSQKFLFTIITVGLPKFLILIFVQLFVDKIGRKPLLLTSSLLMAIFVGIFGIILQFSNSIDNNFFIDSNTLLLIMLTILTGAFSIGYGPITWVLNSEIFPLNIRPKAMGYCTLLNRLTATIVTLTFFSLESIIDFAVFYIYFIIGIAITVFIYFKIPETKSKTLEEITNMYFD